MEMRPTLDTLFAAVNKEPEPDWVEVNDLIGQVALDPAALEWALTQGFIDPSDDNRDLAASLFEASTADLKPGEVEGLQAMLSDPHPFARFRAAFALRVHGDTSPEVLVVLEQAAVHEDEEASTRAKELLR